MAFGNIEKAIRMIQDGSRESISVNLGDRHKVRSFYNNILNPMSDRGDVTIDTHAVAAALLQPLAGGDFEVSHNLGTSGDTSSITGVKGSYGVFADAYREAAAEAGVLPREMQSITWEAIRGLYTGFKTPKNKKTIKNIWKNYDKGTISLDEARGEIYDKAGGINPAAWEDRTEPFGRPDDVGRDSSKSPEDGLPSQSVNYLASAYPEAEMDSLDADQVDSLPEFYHYLPKQDNSEPTPLSQAHSQASLVRTTTPPAALSAEAAQQLLQK